MKRRGGWSTFVILFWGNEKTKNERTQTFSSRKDKTWFRSELLFHSTPLLSLRTLQNYLSNMTKPISAKT